MPRIVTVFIVILLLACPAPAASPAGAADSDAYARILAAHVDVQGRVDYAGLKREEALLDVVLAAMSRAEPGTMDRDARMAFWINVYNAFTLKLVLDDYPGIDSIRDIGPWYSTPWKREFIPVDGQLLSLDQVEKDILIPQFKDPRVHFAINCASASCPPLLDEPYDGAVLDRQLDERAHAFINDGLNVRIEGDTLVLSRIFDWYEEDFGDVPAFVAHHATGTLAVRLRALGRDPRIRYLDYDWSLNDR